MAISVLLNRWTLRAFGVVNRRFGWVASVFVMYPANARYALQVVYPWAIEGRKWSPFPVMVIRQGGRWCLSFAIAADEGEVRAVGADGLRPLVERAQRIQREVGARHLTFSGILPGLMEKHGVPHAGQEAETTVRVVAEAVDQVIERVGYGPGTPVILIGGSGYIGQRLRERLEGSGEGEPRPVHSVDPRGGESALPATLRGQRALLVNVASRRALASYLDQVWEGLVLLNEVYPEPRRRELDSLRSRGVPAYHVVGVEASAFPPFPGAYRGGAPCCAAIPTAQMTALVGEL